MTVSKPARIFYQLWGTAHMENRLWTRERTTYSSNPVKDFTLEDMAEAVKLLKPMPRQKLVMCKKHFKLLNQRLPKHESHANPMYPSILGELGGIPIEIRPYLKKVRLYTEAT